MPTNMYPPCGKEEGEGEGQAGSGAAKAPIWPLDTRQTTHARAGRAEALAAARSLAPPHPHGARGAGEESKSEQVAICGPRIPPGR